jgi:hypothetical protein
MDESRPILSTVIPTRNRAEYAVHAAATALCLPGRDIEVLLHDNGDDDALERWASSCTDRRLRHIRNRAHLSMRGNYEAAINESRGDYVSVIGDDDGVLPQLEDAARWAKARGVDILLPSDPCHYVWPDLRMRRRGGMGAGQLKVGFFSGEYRVESADDQLAKALDSGFQKFHRLPRLYYGLASRSALNRVRAKTGFYVPSLSPDMACAVALALLGEPIHYIDFPLFLPGSSGRSNAGQSGMGRHIGFLENQKHLSADELAGWLPQVPRFYSVQTIWAQAGLETLSACGKGDLGVGFNVADFYAECLFVHWRYSDRILRAFPSAARLGRRSFLHAACKLLLRYMGWWFLRAKCFLLRFMPRRRGEAAEIHDGLENIKAAAATLQERIRLRMVPFPLKID